MHNVIDFIGRHGNLVVFAAVLAEQVGLPVPAAIVLLAAGAAIGTGQMEAHVAMTLSVTAALIGDFIWYELGRRRGRSVLATLCRLSLEPDTCVRRTEDVYGRYGKAAIIFSKFVPGLSTVAPPLAGTVGITRSSFLCLDFVGAFAWAGVYIGAGWIFRSQIEWVADLTSQTARSSFVLAMIIVAGYVLHKYAGRRRLYKELRVARIAPKELFKLMNDLQAPLIVDMRVEVERRDGIVPGALNGRASDIETLVAGLSDRREVVLYCS
jgi:membrane protein DedA with SNARE-associated domain